MTQEISRKEFYNRILSIGEIPGARDIPEDLLRAVSTLVGRNTDECVMPDSCADAVALVVLAVKEFGVGFK